MRKCLEASPDKRVHLGGGLRGATLTTEGIVLQVTL